MTLSSITFEGKTVLITGAATGIGRATAKAFVELGAMVFVNHYNQQSQIDSLRQSLTNKPGQVYAVNADVTQSTEIRAMVADVLKQTGRIDILINNAGASLVKPLLDTSEQEWDHIMNTDLKSVFLCSKAVLPSMLERDGAVIINVASELGFSGRAKFSAYTAAKGGVISLTRSMARELAPTVRVNGVAPGPTKTPLLDKENNTPGHEEELADIPLGRYASAAEIADSIVFLCSDKAAFYCGEIISPNGGALMR